MASPSDIAATLIAKPTTGVFGPAPQFAGLIGGSPPTIRSGTTVGGGRELDAEALDFQKESFKQQDARRQQMLELIFGNTKAFQGAGGLLGTNLIGNILGSTPGGLVRDVSNGLGGSSLFGGGGGGQIGQPGFPDVPGGGGRGGLFGELIGSRRAEGANILQDLANFGGSRRSAINQDFANQGGTAQGLLEARGLGGTDLVTAAQSRVDRNRQQALGELEDQLIGQRVGARMQLGEGLFGDVGDELNRGVERSRIGAGLVGSLLGSALNVASF